MASAFMCVYPGVAVDAAIRVHAFCNTMTEAQREVESLSSKQPDVQAYIVDACRRWIPLHEPVQGSGMEETEIRAPENEDRETGRMGSVCDLFRHRDTSSATNDTSSPVGSTVFESPSSSNQQAKQKQVTSQRTQLDALLQAHVPHIDTHEEYVNQRERAALLSAFSRKLRKLLDESVKKGDDAWEKICELSVQHPEYREQYREHYQRALKQSGIDANTIAFIKYLDEHE